MTLSVQQKLMISSNFEFALAAIRQLISAQANMRGAHVKKSAFSLFGRSQNDFICAAKIDELIGH